MDWNKPVFQIGESNIHVQPGDYVWTDLDVARISVPGQMPVVTKEPICGQVRSDGTVLLTNGTIVELRICRIAEKVIRI